jgi:hypothetical protein
MPRKNKSSKKQRNKEIEDDDLVKMLGLVGNNEE